MLFLFVSIALDFCFCFFCHYSFLIINFSLSWILTSPPLVRSSSHSKTRWVRPLSVKKTLSGSSSQHFLQVDTSSSSESPDSGRRRLWRHWQVSSDTTLSGYHSLLTFSPLTLQEARSIVLRRANSKSESDPSSHISSWLMRSTALHRKCSRLSSKLWKRVRSPSERRASHFPLHFSWSRPKILSNMKGHILFQKLSSIDFSWRSWSATRLQRMRKKYSDEENEKVRSAAWRSALQNS